ncbi:MAG TPA: acyltransferase, partial [Cytophagales bacterium]|nr:acyltransferase [Cytophagales bacterium]
GNLVRLRSDVSKVRLAVGHGGTLTIGNDVFLNGPIISASQEVSIGNHVTIGPFSHIIDSDFHDVQDPKQAGVSKPIRIEDRAWIATRAMILKGVTIGEGAVVAAGAVVTKDVPPYTLVAGVPAKVVKQITPA